MMTAQNTDGATIDYTGTGTFITSIVGFDTRIRARLRLESSSTGTLFNVDDTFASSTIDIIDSTIQGWDSLGTATAVAITIRDSNLVFIGAPLVCTDCSMLFNSVFVVVITGNLFEFRFRNLVGNRQIQMGESFGLALSAPLIRIDPFIGGNQAYIIDGFQTGDSADPVFDVSGGSTGSFSAVADASVGTTTITAVSDHMQRADSQYQLADPSIDYP